MFLTSCILGAFVAGSFAQQATQSDAGIVVPDWNFRYDVLGNPIAVILKDDISGLMNPLRSRILAFLGPLAGPFFFNDVINTDLGRALDKSLPYLNGTRAWSQTMQWTHDQPVAIEFLGPIDHASLLSLGVYYLAYNEVFTLNAQQAQVACPCGPLATCSPRSFGANGGPPFTTRDRLNAMLDAIVAVLQDEALMKEYEKWTFRNPWLEQDQKLMRVAGLPPSAASDLRGLLAMGQYSIYQSLFRVNHDSPVPAVECGSRAANKCTHWVD